MAKAGRPRRGESKDGRNDRRHRGELPRPRSRADDAERIGGVDILGARPRPKAVRGLDARRLDRVTNSADANLDGDLRLAALADVAAVSRHHFARMFALATGLPPHAFVAARRMERAAEAIRSGTIVARAAARVGYAPGHRFRADLEDALAIAKTVEI